MDSSFYRTQKGRFTDLDRNKSESTDKNTQGYQSGGVFLEKL